MATVQSRKDRKEQTRKRILDAAIAVLIKNGSNGFSMREVAKLADIAQPSIYKHFANLSEMLTALANEAKKQHTTPFQQAFFDLLSKSDENSVSELLERMFLLAIETSRSRGDLFRMMVAERMQPHSEFGRELRAFYDELKTSWVDTLLSTLHVKKSAEKRVYYEAVLDAIFAMLDTFSLREHEDRIAYSKTAANILGTFTAEMLRVDFLAYLKNKDPS